MLEVGMLVWVPIVAVGTLLMVSGGRKNARLFWWGISIATAGVLVALGFTLVNAIVDGGLAWVSVVLFTLAIAFLGWTLQRAIRAARKRSTMPISGGGTEAQ